MRYRENLAVLVLTALATAMPARSHAASFDIDVNVGPPPVAEETVPAPGEGYTWAQGYCDYDGGHHVWHRGHWERNHPGEHWRNSEWHGHDGHWILERGHLER